MSPDAANAGINRSGELVGRRILVTGGSLGIGLEVTRTLARRGANVVIAARGPEAIEAALADLADVAAPADAGPRSHEGIVLDVSDEGAWREAMRSIDASGPLHGLVTAAGVLGPIGRLEEIEPRAAIEAIAVNLFGTMLALAHALPRLHSTAGRAVTFSGGGATSPLPRYDAYAASKAAVVRLTENVAASGSIELNCVAPGFVATRIHEQTLRAGPEAAGTEYYTRTVEQLERGAVPAEAAAQLTAFLLSDEARGITGRLISAQWDPWRDDAFRDRLRTDASLATLRRIDDQLFRRSDL